MWKLCRSPIYWCLVSCLLTIIYCTEFVKIFSVNSLKWGLSIDTTFNPTPFSLVNTFKEIVTNYICITTKIRMRNLRIFPFSYEKYFVAFYRRKVCKMAAHSILYQLHKRVNEKKERDILEEAFRLVSQFSPSTPFNLSLSLETVHLNP